LFRSVNGGNSFVKVLGTGTSAANGNNSFDIEITAWGTLYASMGTALTSNSGTIHKSFDMGTTWGTPISITGVTNKCRMELALAPNDSTTIYALVENAQTIVGIIKSTNQVLLLPKL
jgi:hypothetical protein